MAAQAVTGGWTAVSVAILAVAKRSDGNGGRTETVWAELTVILKRWEGGEGGGGGYNTPLKRRPACPLYATSMP